MTINELRAHRVSPPPDRTAMSFTRSLFIALSLIATASTVATAQQRLTLEQVMSAPFASDLVAARRGSSVAWVVNQRGTRNVWVASGPSWQVRQLTRTSKPPLRFHRAAFHHDLLFPCRTDAGRCG